jgi:hypothetical protein
MLGWLKMGVSGTAAFGRQVRLTAVSARADNGVNIRYLLAEASKERLSILFHLVR